VIRLLPLLLALLVALPARAADLVLYQGSDPGAAIAQVTREAHVDAGDLQASTLTALLQGRPSTLQDGGSVEVCAREPAIKADLAQSMSDAESAMAYLEYDKALKALDEATTVLGCLSTPAVPGDAGRLYYLRGLVYYFSKEEMAARAAWTQAHRFDPDLTWDDNFPPDGKPLFEKASQQADAQQPANLLLVPPLDASSLWVDGRPAEAARDHLSLLPGDHLVQYGSAEAVTTVRVALDAGAHPTLVFPRAVTDRDLSWVSTHKEDLLAKLLGATLGTDAPVYVIWGGRTYEGKAGSPDFVLLDHVPAPNPEPLPGIPEPPQKHSHTRILMITGLSVAGVAAITSGLAYARAQKLVDQVPDTADMNAYDTLATHYRNNRTVYRVANALVVVGGVAGAVGIYVPLADGVGLAPGPRALLLEIRK